MDLIIPSWNQQRLSDCAQEAKQNANREINVIPVFQAGTGCLSLMTEGAAVSKSDLLFFIHDDTHLLDSSWDLALEKFFEDNPKCGLVGLGGATRFGSPDIYKTTYQLMQLIRYDFRSNMRDFARHGTLSTQPVQVAFVDGFAMCFRREAYEEMGGWERLLQYGLPEFHGYDMLSSIEMHRLGWEIWMVPIKCHHDGGMTSTTKEYDELVLKEGFRNGQELFEKAHRVAYERGRGILPRWI